MNKLLNGSGQVCGFLKSDFRGFVSKATRFQRRSLVRTRKNHSLLRRFSGKNTFTFFKFVF